MKKKVLLGMSGGLDSTVSAILLKDMGYEVIGLSFLFYESSSELEFISDIQNTVDKLQIKHSFISLKDIFQYNIIQYFINEYLNAKTPFPCAKCNVKVKWKYLFKEAQRQGCDFIATGHYVDIIEENEVYFIKQGKDPDKDQSFFLWNLSQKILSKTIFPLAKLTKKEVREIANKLGFNKVSAKKESMGACFLENQDYREFLKIELDKQNIKIDQGNFIDMNGSIIGAHDGYPYYTIGQRRGLGIKNNQSNFVLSINKENNSIVVGPKEALYKSSFFVEDYLVNDLSYITSQKEIIVKIRYRKQANLATLKYAENKKRLEVTLKEPLDSIAPGQTAVFFVGNKLLGGGFICP